MKENVNYIIYTKMAELAKEVYSHTTVARNNEIVTLKDMVDYSRKFGAIVFNRHYRDEKVTLSAGGFSCTFLKSQVFVFLAKFATLAQVPCSKRVVFTKNVMKEVA